MEARESAQSLRRVADSRQRGATLGKRLAHRAFEDRREEIVLAAEVEIHGAGGHAGGARHVGNLRVEEAALGKHVNRGTENSVALSGRVRLGTTARGGGNWH